MRVQKIRADLHIEPGDPGDVPARALIAQLDAYLQALYPAESNHLVPVDSLRGPDVVFLVARLGTDVVGCGALVDRAGQYGELKRMYVRPDRRGAGVGRAILAALAAQARARGLRTLRLETGNAQPEALALYERAGFRRCDPFGPYRDDPLSLFLELDLTAC
jgi:putative acetyltransferase